MAAASEIPARAVWEARAFGLRPRTQAFIGGAFVDALSDETFAYTSPRDGRMIVEVASCDALDVAAGGGGRAGRLEDGRCSGTGRAREAARPAPACRANARTGVWVNTFDAAEVTTPFGGFKLSGNGRDRSLHAFDQHTQLKTTWISLS